MASSSNRRSGSSGGSSSRKRVVIGAEETVRVHYEKDHPEVETERKRARESARVRSERTGTRIPKPNSAPKPSSAGLRVASQKRDDRDRRRRHIAQQRALLGLGLLLLVSAVAWGLWALWQAPLFRIQTISVEGESHLSASEVVHLAAVPPDATLLRLPAQQILSGVRSSPWISDARLKRVFPHTLVLEVTERVPVALVDTGTQGIWLVARDRHWITERGTEPTGSLLLVKDVPSPQPLAGKRIGSSDLNNAITIVAALSQELRSQTKFVSAPSIEKTMLVLKDSVQVFIGPAEEIAKKDLIARTILKREKNVIYVNVRVTDRPTWRGLDQND